MKKPQPSAARATVLALAMAALATGSGQAGETAIRVAVVNDQSGPFADSGGLGSVIAAKLAAEDMGGKVLGRPIEISGVDHQNKADIAANVVREMFDARNFDVIMDGAASSAALAMQVLARERGKIFLVNGAATSDLTGKECSPTGIHIAMDTYSLAKGTVTALLESGLKSWYLLSADYAFGHAIEGQATKFITEGGGEVVGTARHPIGDHDYSSYLLAAQASGAQVIGVGNAGGDLVNTIKASREFGITEGGQTVTGFLVDFNAVDSLGLETAQGTRYVTPFYWDMNDGTRAFTKRFLAAGGKRPPSQFQADAYAALLHYLKAVEAAGTDDGPTVAQKMKDMPINDIYHTNTVIREDGRVMNDLYVVKVKTPADSKYPYDYLEIVDRLPGDSGLYRPLSEGGCKFIE